MNSYLTSYLPFLETCSACGLCLPACPVFALTGLETDGPRGRLTLLRALVQGKIAPAEIEYSLARCLLCGKCAKACPSQIPLAAIFVAARFALFPWLPVPRKFRMLAHLLCSSPKALDFLQSPVRLFMDYLGRKLGHSQKTLPAFRPFTGQMAGKSGAVLLFSGCIARRVLPELVSAAIKALEHSGLVVLAPPGLVCCGRPLAVQGDNKSLLKALRTNLKILAGLDFEWLTSPCPGCLHTMREIWPGMEGLTGTEREQLNRLLGRLTDISILLAKYNQPDAVRATKIYWHRPCLLDDTACACALRLLGPVPEQKELPVCCGAPLQCLGLQQDAATRTNILLRQDESLAEGLAHRVRSLAGGADCIVTACPGCMLALSRVATMPVRHLVEIHAEQLAR